MIVNAVFIRFNVHLVPSEELSVIAVLEKTISQPDSRRYISSPGTH